MLVPVVMLSVIPTPQKLWGRISAAHFSVFEEKVFSAGPIGLQGRSLKSKDASILKYTQGKRSFSNLREEF